MSWYDIVLRLKLPDLLNIQQQKAPMLQPSSTIIENLVMALMRDSSLRNRRDVSVTLSGMAAVHTSSLSMSRVPAGPRALEPMQNFAVDTSNTTQPIDPALGLSAYQAAQQQQAEGKTQHHHHGKSKTRPHSAGPRYRSDKTKHGSLGAGGNNNSSTYGNGKFSSEYGIPDDRRTRSLQRQFITVKQLLEESRSMQKSVDREMRRLAVSDLDRAKSQEALQTIHKVACGCCQLLFLPVNLPTKVSRKAILDNRIKWSGRLNSRTIFGGRDTNRSLTGSEEQWNDTMTKEEIAQAQAAAANDLEEAMIAREKVVPRCYDQIGVCIFCAQFFQEPEKYRPSYQQIVYEEKKTAYFQQKEREREWWDPLRMVEKDREELEKYLERKQQEEERERLRLEEEEKRLEEEAALAAAEEEKNRLKKSMSSPLRSPKGTVRPSATATVASSPSVTSIKSKS